LLPDPLAAPPAQETFLSPDRSAAYGIINWENTMAAKPSSKAKKPTHEAFIVTGEGEGAF
jgi:hypothetical protein